MTMTLALNPVTNDLILSSGRFNYTTGKDEVAQRILVTLKHFYGEYFLNVPGGVPWYELILGGKDKALVEALLRQAILQVPNVLTIYQFSMSVRDRAMSIGVTVESAFGTVTVSFVPNPSNPAAPYIILDGGTFTSPPVPVFDGGGF
jgi:hypothetical protein